MSTNDDDQDRTWEGDMFPVKHLDSLAAWQKLILWGNETAASRGGSNHEIVTILDLEVGDMVEWFDEPLDDGYIEKHVGVVIDHGGVNQRMPTHASVLMQQVSYTAWFGSPVEKAMFVRLKDRSRQGADPMSRLRVS